MRALALALVVACSVPSRHEEPRSSAADYRDSKTWLCRPDLPDDPCRGDLTTTVLEPDGGRSVVPHPVAHDAPVDCFYIYPTVDLRLLAGNHTDFTDLSKIQRTAHAQIARFSEVCNVYAPLYRQVTIATYWADAGDQKKFFDVAYSDVAAAFHEYLTRFDRGRPIVIVGHSQGSQMAARLIRDTFDQSDVLRPRLLVGMPIGYTVDIPDGQATGGEFTHLAPCTTPEQSSCIVSYLSITEGDKPNSLTNKVPPGHHAACVDPASGPTLGESVFPDAKHKYASTPYVSVKGFYRARCASEPKGRNYLEIAEQRTANDQRPSIVDLGKSRGGLGLHVYDLQFTQGDLIELVRTKLAARSASPSDHGPLGTPASTAPRDHAP